jgi:hypothetical protein
MCVWQHTGALTRVGLKKPGSRRDPYVMNEMNNAGMSTPLSPSFTSLLGRLDADADSAVVVSLAANRSQDGFWHDCAVPGVA